MNLLVTGGCGFIGSNFVNYYFKENPSATIVNIDRCTVHASKDQAANLIKINNQGFMTAAADYMEKFPHTFSEKIKLDRQKRLYTVVVTLSAPTYKKLRNYTTVKEIGTINVAGRNVIEKYLKLWEE
jgi:dTDP-glucose 4,6-dehydratase